MFESKKKRSFVVMDGSDKGFMDQIIGVAEMVTGNMRFIDKIKGNVKYRMLDRNHPTMKVVTVKSDYKSFDEMRKILEKKFPEQVCFDAVL